MSDADSRPPATASVVVVGAGLSGLAAARELEHAGVDVVVLEAQSAVGGRIKPFHRADGPPLDRGAEFTGAIQVELRKITDSFGLETFPVAEEGPFVREVGDEQWVEAWPLEQDPEGAEAFAAASEQLAAMVQEVPGDAPWDAPRAPEWDRMTVAQWLDANVSNVAARALFENVLVYTVDNAETSLLYLLWLHARFGGWNGYDGLNERFVGGTHQIPVLMAEHLQRRPFTSVPVRGVVRDGDGAGATVHYDGGSIEADAVIFAIEPGLVSRIEFSPPLPLARQQLQSRWLAAHAWKISAIYESPWWREEGIGGLAFGAYPFAACVDLSPADASEGVLMIPFVTTNQSCGRYGELVEDTDRLREVALDRLAGWFGERARDVKEFHAISWSGSTWCVGCSMVLPMGVLSTVGPWLRKPVGPLLWAGADTGEQDWMEGAVTAGQRAAREAIALVGAAPRAAAGP